jgi:hypothetical protein
MSMDVSPTQIERARLLLAHEGAAGSDADSAAAAARVYDKLHAHLGPLIGAGGVRALMARSVKLSQGQFCFLEGAVVESSTTLRKSLQAHDPAVALESAAALFGAFFALLATFIGERLTTQALRRAWPTIEEMASSTIGETNQ